MVELDKLNRYFKIVKGLGMQDLKDLFTNVHLKTLKPSDFFIQEGERTKQIGYIRKGLIRCFAINEKGDEVTILIRWEDQFITSYDNILYGRPSRFHYQAIEETELLVMDYDLGQEIIAKNPKLVEARLFFLHTVLKDSLERIESFTLRSPEERYLDFIKNKPNIMNRVPDKYIATMLGMTPVSLSRIRKRITLKAKSKGKQKQ